MDDADWLTFVDVAVASCHYTEKISLFDKADLQFINRCVAYIFAVRKIDFLENSYFIQKNGFD